ncbi:MAG TPA: hypothetical protein VIH03_05140 [Nitrososphaerales archaeon]
MTWLKRYDLAARIDSSVGEHQSSSSEFLDYGFLVIKRPKIGGMKLNRKMIFRQKCGKKHIDSGRFAHFDHKKHLCEYCHEFFLDSEPGIGIEPV